MTNHFLYFIVLNFHIVKRYNIHSLYGLKGFFGINILYSTFYVPLYISLITTYRVFVFFPYKITKI